MQYFTEHASTRREAYEIVRSKYGSGAQIVSQKTIRLGGFLGLFTHEGVEVTGYVRDEGSRDTLKSSTSQVRGDTSPPPADSRGEKNTEREKSDQALQVVLSEVKKLRASIEEFPRSSQSGSMSEHPSMLRVRELLRHNEFSAAFEESILTRVSRTFSLESLQDAGYIEGNVLGWIKEAISVWAPQPSATRRIFIIVGPTGVGKTTTIAKLAAIHSVGIGGELRQSVHMITIDNYRIGARQQIETYGDIMNVPVTSVETADDLYRALSRCPDSGVILVDTIGKSPGDLSRLAEMQKVITACGQDAEVHLAVSATMKTSDIERTLDAFSVFGYKSVILTKLDETARIGSALSAFISRGVPLSYITTGQRVPQDIERARADRIADRIERPSLLATYTAAGTAKAGQR